MISNTLVQIARLLPTWANHFVYEPWLQFSYSNHQTSVVIHGTKRCYLGSLVYCSTTLTSSQSLLQSMFNQLALLFWSHPTQCLEAHPCVPHAPSFGYVICGVKKSFVSSQGWLQYLSESTNAFLLESSCSMLGNKTLKCVMHKG